MLSLHLIVLFMGCSGMSGEARVRSGATSIAVGSVIGAAAGVGSTLLITNDECVADVRRQCDFTAPLALASIGGALATTLLISGGVNIARGNAMLKEEARQKERKEDRRMIRDSIQLRTQQSDASKDATACAQLCSTVEDVPERLDCFEQCKAKSSGGRRPIDPNAPRLPATPQPPGDDMTRAACKQYCRATESGASLLGCLQACPPE